MKINKIKTKKIDWLHINKPTRTEIDDIKKEYDFHPLDIEDCLNKVQRPQINEYSHYIFLILTFPRYNRETKEIESSEVDFFISSKYLISITDGLIPTVNDFFADMKANTFSQEKYMSSHPAFLLYEILHRLQNYTFPMLNHVSQDIENVEKRIFNGQEKKVVKEILNIKRNIVNLRKIMQAHKNVIKKLMNADGKFFMARNMNIYFGNILDQTKDIWDILETQKENINAFQETNESLISYKLNDIMRILTIISVIIIPANLLASIFGMNAVHMPLIGQNHDFYIVISLMFIIMFSFWIFFRKKDWL